MPPETVRKGQVLHWHQVYAQFADAAEAMPIEEVNRELAARGYDLDRVRGVAGGLGRRAHALAADGLSRTRPDALAGQLLPPAAQLALRPIERPAGAPER